eukprot:6154210-Pleurochrysis_carterae.AAC.2
MACEAASEGEGEGEGEVNAVAESGGDGDVVEEAAPAESPKEDGTVEKLFLVAAVVVAWSSVLAFVLALMARALAHARACWLARAAAASSATRCFSSSSCLICSSS